MDRRIEPRTLCAKDVTVAWVDKAGPRQQQALLLDISRSGALLHAFHRIPVGTDVEITYPGGMLPGTVTSCRVSKPNYNLGISLAPGSEWSRDAFRLKGAQGSGRSRQA